MRILLLLGTFSALLIGGGVAGAQLAASTSAVPTTDNPAVASPAPSVHVGSGTVSVQSADSSGSSSVQAGSDNLSVSSSDEKSSAVVQVGPDTVSVVAKDSNGTTSVTIKGSTVTVTSPDFSGTVGPNGIDISVHGQTIKVPAGGVTTTGTSFSFGTR